jgi:uncharacterized UPF0146 family protein
MTGQLRRERRSRPSDGLESVKKTDQVAPVGMGPSRSVAADFADLGYDICRTTVNRSSAGAPPAFIQRNDPTI